MLERGAIRHALNECQLSREQNELWDGEPDMYINQGWIKWVCYIPNFRIYNRGTGERKFNILA